MHKAALFESFGKPVAIAWAEAAAKHLNDLGAEVLVPEEMLEQFKEKYNFIIPTPKENFHKTADFVISFGGDGTMLSAARLMMKTDIPIMGINVGRLGFLAEYSTSELEKSLRDVLNGYYRIVERAVMETSCDGEELYALNDFVIEKKNSSHMITLQVFANDNYIGDYRADGLIITTPTGSTAYSLSCGGPIIAPSSETFCLTPISPHSLTIRPLVLSDRNEIKIRIQAQNGQAGLVGDGQIQRIIKENELIVFKKSEHSIKLIKKADSSYYDLLRQKLLWAVAATDNVFKKDCE